MDGREQGILSGKRRFLEMRSRIVRLIRDFFDREGFLEVETPVLTSTPAPELHIEPIAVDGGRFLITSPELHMKRLLAAGFEKIYRITPAFRSGERGRLHHPEFTILEWYRTGADYKYLQEDCQRLLGAVCSAPELVLRPRHRGVRLDFEAPWTRYTVHAAFHAFAGWEPGPRPDEDRFDLDMVEKVEPNLGFPRPCFLEDYPVSQAALARIKPDDPEAAERFELYWAGVELANGFSELTDPAEQCARFEAVIANKERETGVRYPLPDAFLRSLHSLGPCAGIAFGVDRFVMLLTGADDLDSVVAFPPETA